MDLNLDLNLDLNMDLDLMYWLDITAIECHSQYQPYVVHGWR